MSLIVGPRWEAATTTLKGWVGKCDRLLSRGWVALVASFAVLAGCTTPGSDVKDDPLPTYSQSTVSNVTYAPDFNLVPPEIQISGKLPFLSGAPLSLRATFPAESRVDLSRVRDILWDFSGDFSVGLETTHVFTEPGLHRVSVTVRDVYDRSAVAQTTISVGKQEHFSGVIGVGSGGQDVRPPDDTVPNDHVDHVLTVPPGASHLTARLSYSPTSGTCAQEPLCIPIESRLMLRLFDAAGTRLGEVSTGDSPRILDLDLASQGAHVLRASGDSAANVTYYLTTVITFPET